LSTKAIPFAESAPNQELNDLIISSIQDIKGKNIVKLDLRHIPDAPVEFFIICEGDSTTQVKAISDNVYKKVRENMNTSPAFVEGAKQAKWILVDYFNTVVHIFHPEARTFYELEELWSDAKFTEYQNL
jgi:ribosome-associated protein